MVGWVPGGRLNSGDNCRGSIFHRRTKPGLRDCFLRLREMEGNIDLVHNWDIRPDRIGPSLFFISFFPVPVRLLIRFGVRGFRFLSVPRIHYPTNGSTAPSISPRNRYPYRYWQSVRDVGRTASDKSLNFTPPGYPGCFPGDRIQTFVFLQGREKSLNGAVIKALLPAIRHVTPYRTFISQTQLQAKQNRIFAYPHQRSLGGQMEKEKKRKSCTVLSIPEFSIPLTKKKILLT